MFEMKKVSVAVLAALVTMGISGVASASDEDRGKVVTAGDQSGTFKLPGSNTSLGFYGSIRFYTVHDFRATSPYDIYNDSGAIAIPQDTNANIAATDTRGGKTFMTARNSRLGFVSATPTDWGKVSTKIEMDFASTIGTSGASPSGRGTAYSGSTLSRLRLAQGKIDGNWGSITMGQKWSAFGNLDAFPDEVDVNFVNSGVGIRQPGIQVDIPFGGAGALTASVEYAANCVVFACGEPYTAPNIQSRPDLILKWTSSGKWGSVGVSAMNTQMKYENANSSTRAKTTATAYNIGANINIGANDSIQAQYTGGEGAGRYMVSTNYNIAVYDASNNTINPYKSDAWLIGWGHTWTKTFRSSVAYGYTNIKDHYDFNSVGAALRQRDNHKIKEFYVDLWWSPIPKTEFGLEYNYGKRELYADPTTGDVYKGERSRLEFLAKYSF